MNSKTKALGLLSIIVVAVVAGSLIFVTESIAKADSTASVATDSETTPSSSVNATDNVPNNFGGFGNGPMAMGMEPQIWHGSQRNG